MVVVGVCQKDFNFLLKYMQQVVHVVGQQRSNNPISNVFHVDWIPGLRGS